MRNRQGNDNRLNTDALGRPSSSLTTPDKTISFEYDTVGSLSEVMGPSSVNSTEYDAANRITQTAFITTSKNSKKPV